MNDNRPSESDKPACAGPLTNLTRRRFLASAGASAVSVTLLKSTLVDAAEANSRIDFGLVGCGARGTWIAGLFAKHGGYNVAAVADYFPDKAEAAGDLKARLLSKKGTPTMGGILIILALNFATLIWAQMNPLVELTLLSVVVLGGLGSIHGSVIGSLVIGYVEAITVFALPQGAFLKGAVALSIMVIVLLVRPEGLFGVAFEEER